MGMGIVRIGDLWVQGGAGQPTIVGAGSNLQVAGDVRVDDGGMIRIGDQGILTALAMPTPGLELIWQITAPAPYLQGFAEQLNGPSSEMQAFMRQVTAPASPPEWLSAALAPVPPEWLSAVGAGLRPLSGITLPGQRRQQPKPPASNWQQRMDNLFQQIIASGQATNDELWAELQKYRITLAEKNLPAANVAFVLAYKERGHLYRFDTFCAVYSYSERQGHRYLERWEEFTGEKLRPGRGRRKSL